jgi:hypothetical protein
VDDDGSDSEEERRKNAIVTESTSAQAVQKYNSSVDETQFEHEYILPEDEVKKID